MALYLHVRIIPHRQTSLPGVAVLKELLNSPELMVDGVERAARIREMLVMLEAMSLWSEEMLRLDTDTLTKVLKLGAKIQKLIRGETPNASGKEAEKDKMNAMGAVMGP